MAGSRFTQGEDLDRLKALMVVVEARLAELSESLLFLAARVADLTKEKACRTSRKQIENKTKG